MKKIVLLFFLVPLLGLSQTKIKLTEKGGVYTVPCLINNLPFEFIFDTGASHISLSMKATKILIENGKLTKNDIIGKTNLNIANGDIVEGTIVNIKNFEISGLKFKNIYAIITVGQNVPLLLGQSALRKFGMFSVDYEKNILTIEKNRTKPKVKFSIRIPFDENLNEVVKSYYDFYENKEYIMQNIIAEVAEFEIRTDNDGNNTIKFEFDVTNNSEYDISTYVQSIADPLKFISINVTVLTKEGKTYSKHIGVARSTGTLLAFNTNSDLHLKIKTRKNTPIGYIIEIRDIQK